MKFSMRLEVLDSKVSNTKSYLEKLIRIYPLFKYKIHKKSKIKNTIISLNFESELIPNDVKCDDVSYLPPTTYPAWTFARHALQHTDVDAVPEDQNLLHYIYGVDDTGRKYKF